MDGRYLHVYFSARAYVMGCLKDCIYSYCLDTELMRVYGSRSYNVARGFRSAKSKIFKTNSCADWKNMIDSKMINNLPVTTFEPRIDPLNSREMIDITDFSILWHRAISIEETSEAIEAETKAYEIVPYKLFQGTNFPKNPYIDFSKLNHII